MDRGAWWATVHGVARVGHDLATKRQGARGRRQAQNHVWLSLQHQNCRLSDHSSPGVLIPVLLALSRRREQLQAIQTDITEGKNPLYASPLSKKKTFSSVCSRLPIRSPWSEVRYQSCIHLITSPENRCTMLRC